MCLLRHKNHGVIKIKNTRFDLEIEKDDELSRHLGERVYYKCHLTYRQHNRLILEIKESEIPENENDLIWVRNKFDNLPLTFDFDDSHGYPNGFHLDDLESPKTIILVNQSLVVKMKYSAEAFHSLNRYISSVRYLR